MVAHGKYNLAERATVYFRNAVATFPKGLEIEVKQSNESARKQLVDFGDRLIDWFHEGDIELWLGIDVQGASQH